MGGWMDGWMCGCVWMDGLRNGWMSVSMGVLYVCTSHASVHRYRQKSPVRQKWLASRVIEILWAFTYIHTLHTLHTYIHTYIYTHIHTYTYIIQVPIDVLVSPARHEKIFYRFPHKQSNKSAVLCSYMEWDGQGRRDEGRGGGRGSSEYV